MGVTEPCKVLHFQPRCVRDQRIEQVRRAIDDMAEEDARAGRVINAAIVVVVCFLLGVLFVAGAAVLWGV